MYHRLLFPATHFEERLQARSQESLARVAAVHRVTFVKTAIPAALMAVCVFAMASFADDKPRTIVTRDHQIYEKAVIVDHNPDSVTISYDAGVVRVPVDNLPADIQRELGYASKIPDAPVERKVIALTPQAAPSPTGQKIAASFPAISPAATGTPPPPAPAVAPIISAPAAPTTPAPTAKPFTQAEANALYGTKESSILKKWGKPLKIEKFTDLSQRKVTVLVYDEDESSGTKFWIYDKEGFVSGGICKGRTIHNASKQAKLDATQAAKN